MSVPRPSRLAVAAALLGLGLFLYSLSAALLAARIPGQLDRVSQQTGSAERERPYDREWAKRELMLRAGADGGACLLAAVCGLALFLGARRFDRMATPEPAPYAIAAVISDGRRIIGLLLIAGSLAGTLRAMSYSFINTPYAFAPPADARYHGGGGSSDVSQPPAEPPLDSPANDTQALVERDRTEPRWYLAETAVHSHSTRTGRRSNTLILFNSDICWYDYYSGFVSVTVRSSQQPVDMSPPEILTRNMFWDSEFNNNTGVWRYPPMTLVGLVLLFRRRRARKKMPPAQSEPEEYICTVCGTSVAGDAVLCPECGADVTEEETTDEEHLYCTRCWQPLESGEAICRYCAEDEEYICLTCGTRVAEDAVRCPACGGDVAETVKKPVTPYCAQCGILLERVAAGCPQCGTIGSVAALTAAEEMRCSECGKQVGSAALYCRHCGVGLW